MFQRMRTRFRILAALLALMAFSASFAEQVWAGTCAAEASHAQQSAPASHPHDGMTMPADHPHPQIPSPDDAGCPMQALAAGCALVFFPAAAADAVPATPAGDARVAPHADPSVQLLLVSSLFRPPQR